MKECHEIFITYEEQLKNWLYHVDLLCAHCGEFCPYWIKHHINQCPERGDNDDEELEDDNRIQDKPKTQVEETDMDIKGEAKMQWKTSGLSKNKQKGK